MERGTDRELAAVRARWLEMERQRRAGTRLAGGVGLLALGGLLALLGLASEACVHVGPFRHGCTVVTPGGSGAILLGLAPVAVAAGAWSLRLGFAGTWRGERS